MWRSFQKGQAVVEMALVMPLLITLLLATGYFGHIVSAQQNLNAAARNAAREMAYESSQSENDRILGTYQLKATASNFEKKAEETLAQILGPSKLSVRSQTRFRHDINSSAFGMMGRFEKINEQMHVYRLQEKFDILSIFDEQPKDRNGSIPLNLREPLEFGVGAVFYGGTLMYALDELNPLARFIFRLDSDPTIQVGATALMPAELPLRGTGYGLLELNPWIKEIVSQDINATEVGSDGKAVSVYPSLFDS